MNKLEDHPLDGRGGLLHLIESNSRLQGRALKEVLRRLCTTTGLIEEVADVQPTLEEQTADAEITTPPAPAPTPPADVQEVVVDTAVESVPVAALAPKADAPVVAVAEPEPEPAPVVEPTVEEPTVEVIE